jgi:heat shock protein HslJ
MKVVGMKILKNTVLIALLSLSVAAEARSLLDGDYVLNEWRHAGAVARPQEKAPTLTIQGDRISGFAGCNRYSGAISTLPKLKVGPLATTRMACLGDEAQRNESAVLAVFEGVKRFKLKQPNRLEFSGAKGECLSFVRQPDVIEQVLYIAPEKKSCTGVAPMECMQVRETPAGQWTLFYSQIEGFDYVAGKSYKVKVKREKVANPPADASAFKYVLLEVLGD